jgi:eukaryotic-like serine/threonine-protein kinase
MNLPCTIGQYRITERLATGGAGEVYAGIDTKVGREVAIKFLRPELACDPSYVDRFLAEAKSLGRLNHPNIATLYALLQEDDHVCMIMELVRGRTVEQIIQELRGPLGIRESLAVLAQVADGLSYAHEQGVIHRDIKPSNLMVTGSGRVKIMDFGIARVRGSDRMTRAGSAVGTPLYMSPEQCRGLEGDERSDIYSLAVVLYELLAGAPPFKGATDFELTKAHLGTPPPSLIPRIAGVEPPLESAIMTALSKRPEQRFPSISLFSDAAGATAVRGDATGIMHNYIRSSQAQPAAHETAKPAPLHTALAVVRSRAAKIARRFRGLHPAVQGLSSGGALAMAIVAAVLFRPEQGPVAPNPIPGPPQSSDGQTPGTPSPGNGQLNTPPPSARSALEHQKSPKPPCNPSFVSTKEGDCVTFDPTEQPRQTAEQNPQPQKEASKNQDGEKPTVDPADDPDTDEGLKYLHGESGHRRDPAKAIELISGAAGRGRVPAMIALGKMYYHGDAVKRDRDAAKRWFTKAADAKNGEAMYYLCEMGKHNQAELDRQNTKTWCEKVGD